MNNLSLRQRTLVSLAAIALTLGGTVEIASAAAASSTRNFEELSTTELASSTEALSADVLINDSELMAIKFKKHHDRKFKKHHNRKFKKHHVFYGHG